MIYLLRPSVLLAVYLSVTVLFDIAVSRSLWLSVVNPEDAVLAKTFTAAVAVKAVLAILESQQKRRWLSWDSKTHSPEETSSILKIGSNVAGAVAPLINDLVDHFHKGSRSINDLD